MIDRKLSFEPCQLDQRDVEGSRVEHRARLEGARKRPRQGDLKAVEYPGDAERDDHQRVEAVPRQPVEARRDVALDDGAARIPSSSIWTSVRRMTGSTRNSDPRVRLGKWMQQFL